MPNAKILSQLIKDQLLAYQNAELREVKTWKRGVLPPTPSFPACSVMPELCQISYPRNGQAELHWEFNIEFFVRHRDPKEAIETAQELAQAAKMIMKQHFKLGAIPGDPSSTNVVDTEIQPTYQESIDQPSGQFMQMAVVPVEIIQYEDLPSDRIVATSAGFTDTAELIVYIQKRLEAWARDNGPLSLRSVAQFCRSAIPPIAKYPAVALVESQIDHDRGLTGCDIVNRVYDFTVYTDLLPQEVNLDLNLTLVDILTKIIWVDYAWGNRAEKTMVDEIQFVREQNSLGRVYRSTITADIQCREALELAEARR